MNWDAIGAIAELAGVVGVLFSIIYLAMQVKHNTEEKMTDNNERRGVFSGRQAIRVDLARA